MTPKSDEILNPDDEFGSVEAADPPEGEVGQDPYVEDKNYDESLAELDPDEQGGDLPLPEED